MYDDDVRIRQAIPEEAEELTDIAWRSNDYREPPEEFMPYLRNLLNIKPEFVEQNPCYLLEHEETGEKVGFYALEKENGKLWLKLLWVLPEEIGNGAGGKLFLHACEIAEMIGAEDLYILSDASADSFYEHMGAERIGEEASEKVPGLISSVLRMRLCV